MGATRERTWRRGCRHSHLNTLVKVTGVVTRRTGVYPQMAILYFNCRTCGNQIGPLMQTGEADFEVKPQQCMHCESRGPFDVDQHNTVYRNYQKITLQVRTHGGSPSARKRACVLLCRSRVVAQRCFRPAEVLPRAPHAAAVTCG